jgi:CheY-like chemotaxis protein
MADDIRLVIAEDHPLFRDALRRTFEKCGSMQVVAEAQDGPSALDHIRALTPDVALLDIGLPRMNGYDVCRRLRSEPWGRDLTLVALTGWGQDADRRRSTEAGFDAHLVKPVDYDTLLTLLASLSTRS